MSFAEALKRAGSAPGDATAFAILAKTALETGDEVKAIAPVEAAAARLNSPQLWQWAGLLNRALDRHDAAIPDFDRAATLAPGDAKIAHGRARVALEAGRDAVALAEAARRLAPGDGEVLLCLAAARLAAGDGARAIAELDAVLAANPGWVPGHVQLTHLRWMLGERETSALSFYAALGAQPRNFDLWQALILTLMQGNRFDAALDAIAHGRMALGVAPFFDVNEAVVRSETGEVAAADRLFAPLAGIEDVSLAVRQVRHRLRTGRVEAALPLIDRWTTSPDVAHMWPYAAIAWRLAADPRLAWLEGDPALVGVYDLRAKLPPLDRLAEVLRGLHRARSQHLDQSVRGGTQTDGALFSRIEPEIRTVRAAVVEAVQAHIAQLPSPDPRHPTLAPRRDTVPRFSGSWSVRLTGQGHHANHVHPMGWLSSALYVALPDASERDSPHAGWLGLGQPQAELGLDLPPARLIEPKPGRLVLFPSTMWHGTVPFASGERLTIAFDVAPPLPRVSP